MPSHETRFITQPPQVAGNPGFSRWAAADICVLKASLQEITRVGFEGTTKLDGMEDQRAIGLAAARDMMAMYRTSGVNTIPAIGIREPIRRESGPGLEQRNEWSFETPVYEGAGPAATRRLDRELIGALQLLPVKDVADLFGYQELPKGKTADITDCLFIRLGGQDGPVLFIGEESSSNAHLVLTERGMDSMRASRLWGLPSEEGKIGHWRVREGEVVPVGKAAQRGYQASQDDSREYGITELHDEQVLEEHMLLERVNGRLHVTPMGQVEISEHGWFDRQSKQDVLAPLAELEREHEEPFAEDIAPLNPEQKATALAWAKQIHIPEVPHNPLVTIPSSDGAILLGSDEEGRLIRERGRDLPDYKHHIADRRSIRTVTNRVLGEMDVSPHDLDIMLLQGRGDTMLISYLFHANMQGKIVPAAFTCLLPKEYRKDLLQADNKHLFLDIMQTSGIIEGMRREEHEYTEDDVHVRTTRKPLLQSIHPARYLLRVTGPETSVSRWIDKDPAAVASFYEPIVRASIQEGKGKAILDPVYQWLRTTNSEESAKWHATVWGRTFAL